MGSVSILSSHDGYTPAALSFEYLLAFEMYTVQDVAQARGLPWLTQVVPATLGDLLDQVVVLQSQRMQPLPARVDKAQLRDLAQLPERSQLAALAHRIAAFAEGMRAMEKCVLEWSSMGFFLWYLFLQLIACTAHVLQGRNMCCAAILMEKFCVKLYDTVSQASTPPSNGLPASWSDRCRAVVHPTKGSPALGRTFLGVMELQPTRLLEDGLRAHLAKRAASAAATTLSFSQPPAPLVYPPLSGAGRSSFTVLFGTGASLSSKIPGRCYSPRNVIYSCDMHTDMSVHPFMPFSTCQAYVRGDICSCITFWQMWGNVKALHVLWSQNFCGADPPCGLLETSAGVT
jgi:hypothetical protein